jgi:hypothetical protein
VCVVCVCVCVCVVCVCVCGVSVCVCGVCVCVWCVVCVCLVCECVCVCGVSVCVCVCVICSIRDLHITLPKTSEFRENPRGKGRTFLMEANKITRAFVPRNGETI